MSLEACGRGEVVAALQRRIRALSLVMAYGTSLAFPVMAFAVSASARFGGAVSALGVGYFIGECWLGPAIALLQSCLPEEVHGLAVSVFLFLTTLLGNAAPAIIGAVDPGTPGVRAPLLGFIALGYIGSAILFAMIPRARGSSPLLRYLCRKSIGVSYSNLDAASPSSELVSL